MERDSSDEEDFIQIKRPSVKKSNKKGKPKRSKNDSNSEDEDDEDDDDDVYSITEEQKSESSDFLSSLD